MRKILILMMAVLIAVPALAGGHKTESGWFDMENCAFCKNLTVDPGLLPHTTWETHAIDAGMMQVMTVDPAYAEAMATAGRAMQDLGMKIQSGEVNPMGLKMCGHCMEFGQLMMAGVHAETVSGKAAEVTLFTSDDPALVTRLQAMAARDTKEMELMMAGHGQDEAHPHGQEHPH